MTIDRVSTMFNLFSKDIGIDLGTASVLVYIKGKGVVLREPSVVAMDKNTGKLLKVGTDAQAMLGRTPGNIVAMRPLREGVISDYDMTERMLRACQEHGIKVYISPAYSNDGWTKYGISDPERRAYAGTVVGSGGLFRGAGGRRQHDCFHGQ